MRLEDVIWDRLECRSSPTRWEKGGRQDRELYYDRFSNCFIKVWSPSYEHYRSFWRGRELIDTATESLFGFDSGFLRHDIASAFVEILVDEVGCCRGYVTRGGVPIGGKNHSEFRAFIDRVKEATLATGFAHTDVCYNNLVDIDGKISLIDFDSLLTEVDGADCQFEQAHGCLRAHVFEEYRLVVQELFNNRTRCGSGRTVVGNRP